ncbi:nucleoside-triphosphatase [Clostridium brassicae]|uniref:Methyltransferase domain-containing protein n=1 Tax=Clostridium brassicae TaxID=2999072 RepID=A0ABT4DCK4_9CLOT|nr:nucleoside-triphosphatase [Clostridium brassicae]MCY6960045.1 methyltransferase domain-containing protein [Clostridium brassicae]
MYNLFLTGEIKVGKSTLLNNVIEKLDSSIGGFTTEPVFKDKKLSNFQLISLYDGRYGYDIGRIDNMKNRMEEYTKIFDNEGVDILERSIKDREIIVMDEIGIIESKAFEFHNTIKKALNSQKVVIGVLKKAKNDFLDYIKNRVDTIVVDVTESNRDVLEEQLIDILKKWDIKLKTRGFMGWSKENKKFYNEALEHPGNEYPQVFIEEMRKDINEFKNIKVLDIGAGTGVFTFPLLNEGAEVTAVDSSFSACESIREKAIKKHIHKMKCIISDWTKISYDEKYDIAICAFCFNGVEDKSYLEKLIKCTKQRIYIITYKQKYHKNFKSDEFYSRIGRKPKKFSCNKKNIFKNLDEIKCKYSFKEIKFPFSQYFKNFDEARSFFYNHFKIESEKDKKITDEFIKENLKKVKNELVFPNYRESIMINIDLSK